MAVFPSQAKNNDASVPTSRSSRTMTFPASPSLPSNSSRPMRAHASKPSGRYTPLPAARPSALMTGTFAKVVSACSKAAGLSTMAYFGPGSWALVHSSRMKPLEPSRRAATWLGPQQGMDTSARASPRPITKEASGPGTTRSMSWSWANSTRSAMSSASMSMFRACSPVPPFPGAAKISISSALANARHSACSRPPLPTTKTFMPHSILHRRRAENISAESADGW